MKEKLKNQLSIIAEVFEKWRRDGVSYYAAALAYHSIFSLAPLLLIAISIAGLLWEQQVAQEQVLLNLQNFLGPDATAWISGLLERTGDFQGNDLVAIVGIPLLVFSALNIFHLLRLTLNRVWGVRPRPANGILNRLRQVFIQRSQAFVMLIVVGALVILFLILSASVTVLNDYLVLFLPMEAYTLRIFHFIVAWVVFTLLIGAMFRVLPDVKIRWRTIWLGAAFTSLIFTLAKDLIAILVSAMGVATAYGAAGSAIVFLFWVYISAQIFFLGAEFTQVYARHYGEGIVPADNATFRRPYTPDGQAPQADSK